MKTILRMATFFFVFFLSVSFCFPQDYQSVTAVRFKDGSIVQGKILDVGPDTIRIQRPDGVVETRRYQDVASFIQGPYRGGQPPPLPPAPPPAIVSPPPAPPPVVVSPPPPPPPYVPPPPRRYETYYRTPANYVAFKAGIYSPESDALRDFDSGFNGEIAIGHYFHPNFALELGFGYLEVWAEDWHHHDSHNDNRIWAVPITLSLKPALQLPPFEFYGLAGGGVYFINVELDNVRTPTGSFSFSDDGSVFGVHLGAGFNWNINPRLAIGVEGKYIWAEKTFEKTINNTNIRVDADLQGFQTTLNLTLRF